MDPSVVMDSQMGVRYPSAWKPKWKSRIRAKISRGAGENVKKGGEKLEANCRRLALCFALGLSKLGCGGACTVEGQESVRTERFRYILGRG
jgi:hypothetical protein